MQESQESAGRLGSRPFHAILSPLGTDGDVYPYIGLGRVLRSRGHRVTLVASGNYQERAIESGLEFVPLVSAEEAHALFSDPDFWHPLKGGWVGARWGVSRMEEQYELFAQLAQDPDSLFITSPAIFAGRLVQEKFNRPNVTPLLQPWMIPSTIVPPMLPPPVALPRWTPRPLRYPYFWMIDVVGYFLIGHALNKLRKKIGLPPVPRVFRWWFSPQLTIGMFADWWGPPQADWPKQIKLTGFSMFDGCADTELDPQLVEFLDAGEPPVVFTFGTGVTHATELYLAGLQACEKLCRRVILATKYADQFPQPLPPFAKHVSFAPFSKLFPRCAAVVHHGGIGTIVKCLAAGTPQLVLPIAYDQFENATKVKAFGAGDWLLPKRRSAEDIARSLRQVLETRAAASRGQGTIQFDVSDGLDRAADFVEQLAATSLSRPPAIKAP